MAYVPTRADATLVAADFVARETAAGFTTPVTDRLVAMFDSILCSVGFQQKIVDTRGPGASNTTTSTTPVAMPTGASGSFTAPIAKNYLIHVDLTDLFATVATTIIFFRLVVNGTPITVTNGMTLTRNVANDRGPLSFRQAVAMNAGANTVAVQWSVAVGSAGAATWDTNSGLVITVVG